jgi:hypothetical protein
MAHYRDLPELLRASHPLGIQKILRFIPVLEASDLSTEWVAPEQRGDSD